MELNIPPSILASICTKYAVAELSLFGSRSRGDNTLESDFDILVEFREGAKIGLFEFFDLQRELEAVLHHRVDLVSKSGLKPHIRPHVLKDEKILYHAVH